jgi:hypothetical protein
MDAPDWTGPRDGRRRLSPVTKKQIPLPVYGFQALIICLAATGGILEQQGVSKRPWFGAASKAAFVGDLHRAVMLEKKLNADGGEPLRFLDIAMPVRDSAGRYAGDGRASELSPQNPALRTRPSEPGPQNPASTILPRDLPDSSIACARFRLAALMVP